MTVIKSGMKMNGKSSIFFLGEGDISWYVYDLKSKKYCELDNPSGEVSEEFSDFEAMLDKMLENSLM